MCRVQQTTPKASEIEHTTCRKPECKVVSWHRRSAFLYETLQSLNDINIYKVSCVWFSHRSISFSSSTSWESWWPNCEPQPHQRQSSTGTVQMCVRILNNSRFALCLTVNVACRQKSLLVWSPVSSAGKPWRLRWSFFPSWASPICCSLSTRGRTRSLKSSSYISTRFWSPSRYYSAPER